MKRATTPTHDFIIPFEVSLLEKVKLTYAQLSVSKSKVIIFQKEIKDLELFDNTIRYTLSQEETLMFQGGKEVEIELKVKANGKVMIDTFTTDCERCLCEEVL